MSIDTGEPSVVLANRGRNAEIKSTGALSESADVITRRGDVPMVRWEKLLDQPGKWTFRMEGRVVVVGADTFERLTRSALQNGLKKAEEVLLEAIEQGMVEVIDGQGQP